MTSQQTPVSETGSTTPATPTSLCGRKLSYPAEIDEQLVRWVRTEQSKGVLLSPDILRKEALHLIQPFCYEFKASTGWLDKFLTRHKLSLQPNSHKALKVLSPTTEKKQLLPDAGGGGALVIDTTGSQINNNKQQISSQSSLDNADDDDDEDDDDENESKKDGASSSSPQKPINPERLKAFNLFVRLFIDENLDRLVPISKQPKDKINAIIMSCQRQFPEFSERARKRIRTYLKSCRRSTRLREPSSRPSMSHLPATQLSEVNNILAKACQSETQEVAKRQRLDSNGKSVVTALHNSMPSGIHPTFNSQVKPPQSQGEQPDISVFQSFISSKLKQPVLKLSESELTSVRNLIAGYRQSAQFLSRSANELERLLMRCEGYVDDTAKDDDTEQIASATLNPIFNSTNSAGNLASSLTANLIAEKLMAANALSQSIPKTQTTALPILKTPSQSSYSPITKNKIPIALPTHTSSLASQGLIVDSLLKSKVDAMKEKLVVHSPISTEHGTSGYVGTSVISPNSNAKRVIKEQIALENPKELILSPPLVSSRIKEPATVREVPEKVIHDNLNEQNLSSDSAFHSSNIHMPLPLSQSTSNINSPKTIPQNHIENNPVSAKKIKLETSKENRNSPCEHSESFNTFSNDGLIPTTISTSKVKTEINHRDHDPVAQLMELKMQQIYAHREEHVQNISLGDSHEQKEGGESHHLQEQHLHSQPQQLGYHSNSQTDQQKHLQHGSEQHSQQTGRHSSQVHGERHHAEDYHSHGGNHMNVQHITGHEQSTKHSTKPVISHALSLDQIHSQVFSSQQHSPSLHNAHAPSLSQHNLYQQSKQLHKHNSPLHASNFSLSHVNEHLSPRQHVNHTPPLQHGNHQSQHGNHQVQHGNHQSLHENHQSIHGNHQNQHGTHQSQHINHITGHVGEHLSQHQSHSEQLSDHSSHPISYAQQYYNASSRHAHQTSRISPMTQQQQSRTINSVNYHPQTTPSSGHHHQNVFNFESVNQQLLDSPHQQYLHQRLSPHPSSYHPSLLSPSNSPHFQDLSRQSHLQEISRQSHLQDLNRQMIPDLNRQQSHSDYSNLPHNIQFDMHQSH